MQSAQMQSMTGFASRSSQTELDGLTLELDWELRAVNGRGLDIRFRLPEHFGFLEKTLRDRISAKVARGNLTLSLKLRHGPAVAPGHVDPAALETLIATVLDVQQRAVMAGLKLRAPTALDLLGWRGIHGAPHETLLQDPATLGKIVAQDFDYLLQDFLSMRQREGAALRDLLGAQISRIAELTDQARVLIDRRADAMAAHLQKAIEQVLGAARIDPARLEQEIALIAVKADVTEELDRLQAHCTAAQSLLAGKDPAGRKLDFLTQEFNREANTLCSKAQHLELTRIGLELKSVIDQMREQVQNLE